eukprot:m.16778 g.16778  ORF g.16778 m.16778 type:complete len:455 (-) comp5093_c0_seq2:33-1397(-)
MAPRLIARHPPRTTEADKPRVVWTMPSRRRILYFGVALLYATGFTMTQPVLPFLAKSVSAPDDTGIYFGIVLAAYPLAKTPIVPLIGHESDRFGHRAVLTTSLMALGFCFALTTCVTGYNELLFCRLLTGAAGGNGALLHAWIPKLAHKEDHILFFADLSMAWSFAAVIAKYAVPLFDENFVVCFSVAAMCQAMSAGLVLLTFWLDAESISEPTEHSDDTSAQPARPWSTPAPRGSQPAVENTGLKSAAAAENQVSLWQSLCAFLSDRVVCIVLLCELLTPRFDHFLASKDKGATASVVADIQGNAALLSLAAQTVGFNKYIYRTVERKASAVFGLIIKAGLTFMMTTSSLWTFHMLALLYALTNSVVEPACRTVLQSRATVSNHGAAVGAWVGWLHTARAVTQLMATMTSSYLASNLQLLYCPSISIMLVATAFSYRSVPYSTANTAQKLKEG